MAVYITKRSSMLPFSHILLLFSTPKITSFQPSRFIHQKQRNPYQKRCSVHCSVVMCRKILYLCACGHYASKSTRAPCPVAYSESVSTPSTGTSDAITDVGSSTESQGNINLVSPIWPSWDVDACTALECIYRKRDPYWKRRWCEERRGRGERARNRLIEEFGSLERPRTSHQKSIKASSSPSEAHERSTSGRQLQDPRRRCSV
jgi:hypothetical protein